MQDISYRWPNTTLSYLWRWKVLSTAALTEKFFPERSPITAYTRLWHLREGNYIRLIPLNDGKRFVWGMDQRGLASIKNRLPDLREIGFKSENVEHDHLVSAIHIGEWLTTPIRDDSFLSEQELRRYHPDHYPEWVPRATDHRPDGYWRVNHGGKMITIALEVELNRKADRFYKRVAQFYERSHEVFRVVWVVPSRASASTIGQLLSEQIGERAIIHNFLALPEFQKDGWLAPILIGAEPGKSLWFLLDPTAQTCSKPVWSRFLLDTRKCPHKSKTYLESRRTVIHDRYGHTPIFKTLPEKNP